MKIKLRIIGLYASVLLLVASGGTAIAMTYLSNPQRNTPMVFSNSAMLYELWLSYKANDLEPSSHRTLDKQNNNISTSEGEGYTMLRSTWMDDETTFDQSWQWTQETLQRPDHLFAWKYGPLPDGHYGVEANVGGQNTASDGDTDIALSLLMAYSRWGDTKYLDQAKPIITSIWNQEVVSVNGKPVLTADNLERNSKVNVVVNPSYFAPYAYKIFTEVDPTHNWKGLTDNSYSILDKLSSNTLGAKNSDGLPPDWIIMNRQTGELIPTNSGNLDTNYGYDAMRTTWRLALDWTWYHDYRDKQVLSKYSFLKQQWQNHGKLSPVYAHDGTALANYESPAAYGTDLGYFIVMDPVDGNALYKSKLQTLYSPDRQTWQTQPSYFDDNWTWLGMALYLHSLPNITEHF